MHDRNCILTINGGSSGIKFSLYRIEKTLNLVLNGQVEYTGIKTATISLNSSLHQQRNSIELKDCDEEAVAQQLVELLQKHDDFNSIKAIGHRIVHGLMHKQSELITPALINELKKIQTYDPDHLPQEIKLIELFEKLFPSARQIACFDTAFHSSMPAVAKMLAIPRHYYETGIQRYGFHGISYSYLMEELENSAGHEIATGKIILAHLGNGASLAAVRNGESIDTTMGFTPASGIMMGTRCGDLDPGVAWYLMNHENLSPKQVNDLVNHESGLLGISETSSDMRELVKIKDTDSRASEAIELFCYQARKGIGSLAAALGGLDALVFSGGIGEHSPEVRSKICDGLSFLGIDLNEIKNRNNEPVISMDSGKVPVRVIKTNEEVMIARSVLRLVNLSAENQNNYGKNNY